MSLSSNGNPRSWAIAARLAYLGVILLATVSGVDTSVSAHQLATRLSDAFNLETSGRDVVDGLRNVLLFAGWGLVWIATGPGNRLPARVGGAVTTSVLLSVAVELAQLASSQRTTSILDVGTNTIGGLVGAVAMLLAIWTVQGKAGRRSFLGIPGFLVAGAYAMGAAFEAFIPLFPQDRVPDSQGGPLDRLGQALSYFDWGSVADVSISELLLVAPAGAFCVAALVERGASYRLASVRVSLAGVVLAFGIQMMRGCAGETISAGAILGQSLAVGIGALIGAKAIPPLPRICGKREESERFTRFGLLS